VIDYVRSHVVALGLITTELDMGCEHLRLRAVLKRVSIQLGQSAPLKIVWV
jgi:hypothetical protein